MKYVFDNVLQEEDHEMCQTIGIWHMDDGFGWWKGGHFFNPTFPHAYGFVCPHANKYLTHRFLWQFLYCAGLIFVDQLYFEVSEMLVLVE